jgi:hypothetical protein
MQLNRDMFGLLGIFHGLNVSMFVLMPMLDGVDWKYVYFPAYSQWF